MRSDGWARRFLRTWREDYIYQTLVSSAVSFGCTALFALYNGSLYLSYGLLWHGSIGTCYLLLVVIRGMVLLTEKRNRTRPGAEQHRCRCRTFLISAGLLLTLDLALILPISMMAVLDKPVSIGLSPAIAMAAYTTWKITMASIHIDRQRSRPSGNILVAELRTDNFIDALVKRTTADENDMLPVCAASSGVIYIMIVAITIRMLQRGLKQAAIPAR